MPETEEQAPIYDAIWLAEESERAAAEVCEGPMASYDEPMASYDEPMASYDEPTASFDDEWFSPPSFPLDETGATCEPLATSSEPGPFDHYAEPREEESPNKLTFMDLFGGIGKYINDAGQDEYGVQLGGTSLKGEAELVNTEHFRFGGEIGGPDFKAGVTHNEDVSEIGAQASVANAALSAAKQGTGSDIAVKYGVSEGPGAALRAHHSDDDNDGRTEYGLGMDYEYFSGDLKTEDPMRWAGGVWTGVPVEIVEGITGEDLNITEWLFGDD